MASSSSEPLSPSTIYQLGQYQFKLNVTKSQEGDSKQIQAQMTENDQSKYHSIYVDGDATVESWRVEANESTADVYAIVKTMEDGDERTSDLDTGNATQPIPVGNALSVEYGWYPYKGSPNEKPWMNETITGAHVTSFCNNVGSLFRRVILLAGTSNSLLGVQTQLNHISESSSTTNITPTASYTHDGRTVYYYVGGSSSSGEISGVSGPVIGPASSDSGNITFTRAGAVAWTMVYGSKSGGDSSVEEKLIARFAIDLETANGGPSGDWDEPGDTGDPQYRLDLTVWGALSGRHNDPLHDPSYSYVPADQNSVKGYGSGGDGGHGGGGGGGASTVIVYDFATDKAGSKEINAYARRHGYGSSGGRGGRGGDGCIIVYY